MPFIKINPAASRCPYFVTITSPGGVIELGEKKCILDRDHDGPHRSADGAVWQNDVQRMRDLGYDT